ncbi:MAG: redox-sensing transcriptional repressor Rex [Ruminococcaceae bacterium]|nr:redox-sensing transcriptional repressor Rex [Oscillospiraceae bacterium]
MMQKEISKSVLRRLPGYLAYLKAMPEDASPNVSATFLANALGMGEVQVRKDLAMVSDGGRPKVGYNRQLLINDIEQFLGYDNTNDAVLVGAGRLGRALLGYSGFAEYGLNIICGFDVDENIIGLTKTGKTVLPMQELERVCRERKILMGILTVSEEYAQQVCDEMIRYGIRAIWNFAPVHLNVPEGVLVQNENMATSLAVLSKHLSAQMKTSL